MKKILVLNLNLVDGGETSLRVIYWNRNYLDFTFQRKKISTPPISASVLSRVQNYERVNFPDCGEKSSPWQEIVL